MRAVVGAAAGAAALAGYAFYEPFRYRFVAHDVQVARLLSPLSILHVSDTHFRRGDARLARFLQRVAGEIDQPDLVVATGDLIQDDSGIELALASLCSLEAKLGRYYVLGSHDYFRSDVANYAKYFTGRRELIRPVPNDSERLEEGLQAKGWKSVANATDVIDSEHGRIRIAGVDDPHIKRHRTHHVERRGDEVLAIALVHAPDVVSEWVLAGFDLICAGHTHAGQVRLPLLGALVTNSSLPAELAGGLARVGSSWLHVSPGLGTGEFSPIRFRARPELTLLHLRS